MGGKGSSVEVKPSFAVAPATEGKKNKAQTKEQNKMKKLMIAAAIVCAAAVPQATTFSWAVTGQLKEVNFANVTDNGMYAADGTALPMGATIYTAVLTLFEKGTQNVVGQSAETTVNVGLFGGSYNSTPVVNEAVTGTTYDYLLVVTGAPEALTGKTSDKYDYSNAYMQWFDSGSVTAMAGSSDLAKTAVTQWAVNGIVPKEIPEPTSGLLMLLGVAGLALRRRRA